MTRLRRTTSSGFENRDGQIVVMPTSKSGTDHNQYIYILRCKHRGTIYDANGQISAKDGVQNQGQSAMLAEEGRE